MGWGKRALSCNKTSVPQAECRQHPSTLLCHCRRGDLVCWEPWPCCSLWGCAAPSALPGMSPGSMCCAVLPVFAHGSFSLGEFTCVDTRQGLTWQLWCCAQTGRSLEWFLIFEVVPRDLCSPCSGRLVLSTRGLHWGISCFPGPAAWL